MSRLKYRFGEEQLEHRLCLTSVGFSTQEVAEFADRPHLPPFVKVVDLDGDRQLEIVIGDDAGFRLLNAEDGSHWSSIPLIETVDLDADVTQIVDMDGDGDWDIYSRYQNRRWGWFEQHADGSFSQTLHPTPSNRQFADLDGDGDLDGIALAGFGGTQSGQFMWYETQGGELGFGPQHLLDIPILPASRADGWAVEAPNVFPVDVDMDGDLDLLTIPELRADAIRWYPNLDGDGSFGASRQVALNQFGPRPAMADFDGDGDLDLLLAHGVDDGHRLDWFRNDGGQWSQFPVQLPAGTVHTGYLVADIDLDGHVDIVARSWYPSGIVQAQWYRLQFSAEEVRLELAGDIVEPQPSVRLISVDDVDGDGDIDILLGRHQTAGENGQSAATRLYWMISDAAQRAPVPGDVDGDRRVTFDDFLVLAANYGRNDRTRSEGDFDLDGRVSFADFLVLASRYENIHE